VKRFRVSPQAKSDLQEIHAYIASDNQSAADRLIDRFFDHFQRLAEFPELGSPRDDLHPGLRLWPEGRYVILYLPTPTGVGVAHVVHGARDIESLLAQRRSKKGSELFRFGGRPVLRRVIVALTSNG
jgi:toxin ParE1/3/4